MGPSLQLAANAAGVNILSPRCGRTVLYWTSHRLVHGSSASVPQADGASEGRASGTTGFVFLPGDAGPGDTSTGRIYLSTGNVRLVEDSSGAVVSFESQGQMEDVCAMIAS